MSSSPNLTQARICVEKLTPNSRTELKQVLQSATSTKHAQKLGAAFYTKKLWPMDSKIRIGFTETGNNLKVTKTYGKNIDPIQKQIENLSAQEAVKKVVRERIIPLVDLDIDFVNSPDEANIRISFDPNGGAWSLVGTDNLEEIESPTMNFGWLDAPTIMHEMGHMLGMIHEHQNPQGQSIEWDNEKVYEWAKQTQGWDKQTTQQNIIDKYDISSINGSSFDPQSIMLYFFPAELTTNNVGTEQNVKLSGLDVDWIYHMYPKQNGTTPEQFYKNTYGESLQSSINKSEEMALEFKYGKTTPTIMTLPRLYYILGLLGVLLIFILLWYFSK
jgi:hypothetical protein